MIEFKVGEIYCFKLSSGEEVVAKVEKVDRSINDKSVVGLSKPLSVGMGAEGPQLVPTMMSGNPQELFWVNIESCAVVGNIGTDMYDVYTKSTTALDLPPDKQILRG